MSLKTLLINLLYYSLKAATVRVFMFTNSKPFFKRKNSSVHELPFFFIK